MPAMEPSESNIPSESDEFYETIASQEEVYLEEVEIEVFEVLESNHLTERADPGVPEACVPASQDELREQRVRAAEDLITSDGDDPPIAAASALELEKMSQQQSTPGIDTPLR